HKLRIRSGPDIPDHRGQHKGDAASLRTSRVQPRPFCFSLFLFVSLYFSCRTMEELNPRRHSGLSRGQCSPHSRPLGHDHAAPSPGQQASPAIRRRLDSTKILARSYPASSLLQPLSLLQAKLAMLRWPWQMTRVASCGRSRFDMNPPATSLAARAGTSQWLNRAPFHAMSAQAPAVLAPACYANMELSLC